MNGPTETLGAQETGLASDGASGPRPNDRIRAALGAVRRRAVRTWWATAVLAPLGAGGLLLVAAVGIDHLLVLPPLIRLLLLAGVVLVGAGLLRRSLCRHPEVSDQELALLVEQRYPDLDNVLINSLQLIEQTGGSRWGFVDAITDEAERAVRGIKPDEAVDRRGLRISLGAVAAALLLVLALALVDTESLGAGLGRVLLPYGDNTLTRILEVDPGDRDVLIHSDVTISARIGRRVPTRARLVCRFADGAQTVLPLTPRSPDLPDVLTTTIGYIERDVVYRVEAGDDHSESFRIRVHRRPAVTRITQTITPPDYIQTDPVERIGGTIEAVPGSMVGLQVHSSMAPQSGRIVFDDERHRPLMFADEVGEAELRVAKRGRYQVELVSAHGFRSEPVSYDILPLHDRVPDVEIVEPAGDLATPIDTVLRVSIAAEDDFALREIVLVRLRPDQEGDDGEVIVERWSLQTRDQSKLTREATLRVAELGLDEKTPVTLQALAYDWRPDAPPGRSNVLTLRLPGPAPLAETTDTNASKHGPALADLIARQRLNLAESRALLKNSDSAAGLPPLIERQEQIRRDALLLTETAAVSRVPGVPGGVRTRLGQLAETLMTLAVEQLRRAGKTAHFVPGMQSAIETERAILKALLLDAARRENDLAGQHEQQRAIAEMLADLIARQKTLRADTAAGASNTGALATRQTVLARDVAALKTAIDREARTGAGGNRTLAEQYALAAKAFDQRRVRPNMLIAAERLEAVDRDGALEGQDRVLADLLAIQQMLQEALLSEARKEIEQVLEALQQEREKVDKLAKVQQAITEVAEQLHKTEDLTEGRTTRPEDLQDLAEARENIAEAIEQLVQDLHLLPPMSVSNDLLSEMSEIYEDITQAEGSADDPISEVAVDRDEGLLEMLKKMQEEMKERLPDLEMWLMDRPDTVKWNQESFDRDELGEIPLGDLPDALEDIVGDLLEQAEQLSSEAEDTASNAAIPDMTMGWDIMDGPMPSWAAKGKSGNERPNANEQVGRSGSGRQGKSSGEIVGDTVKALEGAEVETRRTNDGFQAGQLKEEDPGAMDTKATGGGKLAGTTDTEGMAGDAPPRDELQYRTLARRHQKMERNVESVYTRASLLRLPTGELDRALLELDVAARQLSDGDLAGFARSQQQVVRALEQTRGRLTGRPVVLAPGSAPASDTAIAGAAGEPIPKQYEEPVARYMRRIAGDE